jgi:ankyrin repeat protein
LLAKGANSALKSVSGKTALDIANNSSIIELLKAAQK